MTLCHLVGFYWALGLPLPDFIFIQEFLVNHLIKQTNKQRVLCSSRLLSRYFIKIATFVRNEAKILNYIVGW